MPDAHSQNTAAGTSGRNCKGHPGLTKLKGHSLELRTHVYDLLGSTQVDQFTYNTRQIAEYVGANYSYGVDIKLVVENLQDPIFPEPRDLPTHQSQQKLRRSSTPSRSPTKSSKRRSSLPTRALRIPLFGDNARRQ